VNYLAISVHNLITLLNHHQIHFSSGGNLYLQPVVERGSRDLVINQ